MKLNIVLFEPEIAGNVGAIMRTCAAIDANLHLIEPFGFFWDQRFLNRSSVHYINDLNYKLYPNWEIFKSTNNNPIIFYATRYGKKPHSDFNYKKYDNIYLMFGKESTGIPLKILANNQDFCFRIPMRSKVRSLNLANCVSIAAYEVLRQFNFSGLSTEEVQKGSNWLDKNK